MRWLRLLDRHRGLTLVAVVLLPLAIAGLLGLGRDHLPGTPQAANAALVLVLVVVGAAAVGPRLAGPLAALAAGVGFDVFLTVPYGSLAITDPSDIETAVLLVAVGVAVAEVVAWGRRQQDRAGRRSGFLAGVVSAANAERTGPDARTVLAERVAGQLVTVLGIDRARFGPVSAGDMPTLQPDGEVLLHGRSLAVETDGLPTDTWVRLPVHGSEGEVGEFLLTAAARISRPTLEERQVAALLADQVGRAVSDPR